ncbi:ABC transporter substrate-binding protein [Aureimonas populi]|uniref:ABC transporter substrate-binding protein n=1 Tax=Aureimonas populi TaxID=1701758 RepID=A0ABW5CK06_9HYPH|nr:ABC transporter substrate-binding protein [Aureimonas populi]
MRLMQTLATLLLGTVMTATPLLADTIRVGIGADMISTNVGVRRDSITDIIMSHVAESLVGVRDDLDVGPALAESWVISEDGRDYTFTLREGALFHNGAPVTAAEVVWSWERMLDPQTEFLCRNWFDGTGTTGIEITGIEAVDERRVRFTLEEPNALFLPRMAHVACLSAIIHPDSVSETGEWIDPIATGPYTIADWRRNQYVELARFERYVPAISETSGYSGAREPLAERVRFLVISDPAAAKSALLAGDVDVLPSLDMDAADEVEAAGFDVSITPTPGQALLLMQTEDPLLSDNRVRRAIAHAINREEAAFFATAGRGAPNPSALAPQSAFFGPEFQETLAYDPDMARQLLAESGYSGEEIRIVTSTRNPALMNSAVAIQGMLQAAGINAQLEVLEWAAHFDRFSRGDYQAMVMSYSARPDPTMALDVFVGDKASRANAVVGNPAIIEAVTESGLIQDRDARREKLLAIHRMLQEDASALNLFNLIQGSASSPELRGYTPWALGTARLWGVSKAD